MPNSDPAELTFRVRPDVRPLRRSPSSMGWWLLVFVAAAGLLFLVHGILDRSAYTAGSTPAAAVTPVRSDAELKAELATELEATMPLEGGGGSFIDASPSVTAGSSMVYRCVASGGAVIFQSQPCAPDQQTTRVIHAPPDREGPRSLPATPSVQNHVEVVNTVNNTVGLDDRERRRRNCEAARRRRDKTLERVGLARTYDLLQKLDAQVHDACKGL